MNSIAGKLELLRNMYDNGFLCKCTDWRFDKQVDSEVWAGEVYEKQLHHRYDCTGKEIFKTLLEFNEDTK